MTTRLRIFTVIFLAILQLIAPLVHAHTGENIPVPGFHVPGLEMYGVDHVEFESQVISRAFSSDGILVAVDAGMIDKKISVDTEDNGPYLQYQALAINIGPSPFYTKIPSQSSQIVCRLIAPSQTPRAPPAQ